MTSAVSILANSITPGSIVHFQQRDNEPPIPAIVLREWPDQKVQLYALHFESVQHVYAADPSTITPILDPLELQGIMQAAAIDISDLQDRVLAVEIGLKKLIFAQQQTTAHNESANEPEEATDAEIVEGSYESEESPESDVEPTQKKEWKRKR